MYDNREGSSKTVRKPHTQAHLSLREEPKYHVLAHFSFLEALNVHQNRSQKEIFKNNMCLVIITTNIKRYAPYSKILCELRLSGNHTVMEYEMQGKRYSQKSGLKIHTNEQIFQVMTRL